VAPAGTAVGIVTNCDSGNKAWRHEHLPAMVSPASCCLDAGQTICG